MSSATLGVIMFVLVSFSWVVYLVQELFISGASALNMSIAKNEEERKQIQVSAGLHFDGMEVWFIAAESLTFAAFPLVYATIFSQLYVVFFLILYALIMRAVSLEMMYKLDSLKWQKSMRVSWTISSVLLIFLFGVYITSLFFGFNVDAAGNYATFFSVLNVTTISGGLFFTATGFVAGAGWIHFTTEGEIAKKAVAFVKKVGVIYMAPIFLLLTFMGLNNTETSIFIGELFSKSLLFFILPILAIGCSIVSMYFGFKQKGNKIFLFALLSGLFYLITGFFGSFPYMVHSSVTKEYGITITDAMAGKTSLTVIFIVIAILYPIVIGYQTWKYIRFSRHINLNDE